MLYAFHGIDGKDGATKRQEFYPQHRAHLANAGQFGVAIVISGPLVADDGKTPVGSLIVVEAANRNEAENFYKNDPFFKAGVWDKININTFMKVNG